MIGMLHTWGQECSVHPHVHCILPGGGINCKRVLEAGKYPGKGKSVPVQCKKPLGGVPGKVSGSFAETNTPGKEFC